MIEMLMRLLQILTHTIKPSMDNRCVAVSYRGVKYKATRR
jgi:photosystem II stability/assembly factor-like uncharacterized protein